MTKPQKIEGGEKEIKYADRIMHLGKSKGFGSQMVYFSTDHTIDSWKGGKGEQLIWEITIFGYRISIWKPL